MAGKRKTIFFIVRHATVSGYPCEYFEVHCGLWVPWMDQATEFLTRERAMAYVEEFDLPSDGCPGHIQEFTKQEGQHGFMGE